MKSALVSEVSSPASSARRLPDGRRLVIEIDQPTKVIDVTGHEMAPSPSEIVALMAVSEMSFPKKFRTFMD
jgi:hypothetical protein